MLKVQNSRKIISFYFICFSPKCSSGHQDCSSRQNCRKKLPKSKWKHRSKSNISEKMDFFMLIMSLQVFLCTRRLQLWQACRKKFAKRPQNLHSEFKNASESYNFFRIKIFPKKVISTYRVQSCQHWQNLLAIVKKTCKHVIQQCWSFSCFSKPFFWKVSLQT